MKTILTTGSIVKIPFINPDSSITGELLGDPRGIGKDKSFDQYYETNSGLVIRAHIIDPAFIFELVYFVILTIIMKPL